MNYGLFAPKTIRSLEHSHPGTFAPWYFPSEWRMERKYATGSESDMLSHFHMIPDRYGQTEIQTDRFAISISRVSMLTRDKNQT